MSQLSVIPQPVSAPVQDGRDVPRGRSSSPDGARFADVLAQQVQTPAGEGGTGQTDSTQADGGQAAVLQPAVTAVPVTAGPATATPVAPAPAVEAGPAHQLVDAATRDDDATSSETPTAGVTAIPPATAAVAAAVAVGVAPAGEQPTGDGADAADETAVAPEASSPTAVAAGIAPAMTITPLTTTAAPTVEGSAQPASAGAPTAGVGLSTDPTASAPTQVTPAPPVPEPSVASTPGAPAAAALPIVPTSPPLTPSAVTAQGAATPTVPTPPSLPDQLVPRIASVRALGDGVHRLTLRVEPEAIGAVRVVAEVRGDAVRLELFGGTEAAREALRAALPDLRRDLASIGLQAQLDLGMSGDRQPGDRTGRSFPGEHPTGARQDVPAHPDPTGTGPQPARGPGRLDVLA